MAQFTTDPRQWAFCKNTSAEPQSFLDGRQQSVRYHNNDYLMAAPGHHVRVRDNRITLEPGQCVKMPRALWSTAVYRREWAKEITEGEFNAALDASWVSREEHERAVAQARLSAPTPAEAQPEPVDAPKAAPKAANNRRA